MDKLRLLKIAAAGKTAADAASGGGGGGGGSAATGDPHYSKVIAHFDSANTSVVSNQNQSFEDTSTNGHALTVGGNPTSSTSSPYYPPKGYRSVFYTGGQYTTVPADTSHTLGTDFTLEAFVYVSTSTNYGAFASNQNSANVNDAGTYFFRLYSTTLKWQFQIGGGSGFSQAINSSTVLETKRWYHLAVTRTGGTIYLWQDGVQVGSSSESQAFTNYPITIGDTPLYTNPFSGYISNLRIVNGTAVYTSAFDAPTSPLTAVSGTGLLTCQSPAILDESSNAHALTHSSNPKTSSFYPSHFQLTTEYSNSTHGGSVYYDGNDYIKSTSSSSTFEVASDEDFTIEMWIRIDTFTNYGVFAATYPGSEQDTMWLIRLNATAQSWFYRPGNDAANNRTVSSTVLTLRNWHHIALVRNSGTTYLYQDGKQVGSVADVHSFNSNAIWLGNATNTNYPLNGSIADFRFVVGTAIYTSNFTPPTSRLAAVTGTQFMPRPIIGLEEQTGKDLELTYNGNAQVINNYHHLQYASKFNNSNSDYFTIGSTTDFDFGTGEFCYEIWFKTNVAHQDYRDIWSSYSSGKGSWLHLRAAGTVIWGYSDFTRITSNDTINLNQWYHIAIVRDSSNVVKMYINGQAQNGTHTVSGNAVSHTVNPMTLGYIAGLNRPFGGYMADFRFVRGSAVYTSNFTPPKVPLTAITNTQCLISTDESTFQDSSTNSLAVSASGSATLTKLLNYKDTKTFDIDSSLYFDGVGDYINVLNHFDNFNLTNQDFTIELWFKRSAVTDSTYADSLICDEYPGASIALAINPTGYTGVSYSTSAGTWAKVAADPGNTYGSIQTELEKWYHFAVVRSGSTGYQFINGVLAETWSFGSVTLTNWTSGMNLGKWHSGTSRHFHGEIYGLRMTKGVARYTENFTVPTSKKLSKYGSAASGQGVTLATDAYFANTVFLQSANTLPANTSIDDNETILDASTTGSTVTLANNTKVKPFNPYTPVGEWSIEYTGTSSYTYWTNPSAAIPPQIAWLDGASDNGTFECWVWLNGTQPTPTYVYTHASLFSVGQVYLNFGVLNTGYLRYFYTLGYPSQDYLDSTTALNPYQWHHVALVRDGTDLKMYIDGVLSGTKSSYAGTSWASGSSGQTLYHGFGGNTQQQNYFKGYISNMRSSDNVRYTGTFDVPTEKFTSDANTLYLSHDNNNSILQSRDTNQYELVHGTTTYAKVSSFAPYDANTAYQNTTGSVEFDGTTDYITVSGGSHFDLGTGDITLEFWFYPRTTSTSAFWFGNYTQGGQPFQFVNIASPSYFWAWGVNLRGYYTFKPYNWYHLAAVRSSGTVSIYVNGESQGTPGVYSSGIGNSSVSAYIGEREDGYYDLNALISDMHLFKGYAKYTSNFTPPTSPIPLHNNTVMSLPFNNLSFYDTTENTGLVSSSTDGALAWPIGRHIKYASWHEKNSTTQYYQVSETASNEFTFGTGDVTMECFYFPYYTTQSSYGAIMTTAFSNDAQGPYIGQYNNTNLGLLVGSSGAWSVNTTTSNNPLIMGRWNHIAYAREGNVHRLYCNGEKVLEVTNAVSSTNTNDKLTVGGRTNGSQYGYGWIGDVRVVKGTALYTTDYFDVPKEALTEVTNTVFLQSTNSTTLQDSSSNGLSITNSGSVTYVNRKANLKVATTPMIFDGASYVDLTENKNATGKFGTQDFTIEAYIMRYPLNATYSSWLSTNNGSFASGAKAFRFGSGSANVTNGTGKIHILWQGVGDSWLTSTSTFNDNEWYHFALVREGNTFSMYVNGSREATDTQSGEFNLDIGSGVRLGKSEWDGANGFFSGQISQLRITVGNARYSGAGFIIPDNYFPGKNA